MPINEALRGLRNSRIVLASTTEFTALPDHVPFPLSLAVLRMYLLAKHKYVGFA